MKKEKQFVSVNTPKIEVELPCFAITEEETITLLKEVLIKLFDHEKYNSNNVYNWEKALIQKGLNFNILAYMSQKNGTIEMILDQIIDLENSYIKYEMLAGRVSSTVGNKLLEFSGSEKYKTPVNVIQEMRYEGGLR